MTTIVELGWPKSGQNAQVDFSMTKGEVYAVHFKTPGTLPTSGKVAVKAFEFGGPQVGRLYKLSTTAGDLSGAAGPSPAPMVNEPITWFKADTDYYFNLEIGETSSSGPFGTRSSIQVPRSGRGDQPGHDASKPKHG